MSRTKRVVVAGMAALTLLGMGAASAGPVEDFCERSPRDGKAVWYRVLCE